MRRRPAKRSRCSSFGCGHARRSWALALLAAGLTLPAAPAAAAWDPPQIASFNGPVQGSGYEVALSGSGDHVVFTSAAYGLLEQPAPAGTYRVGGIFRRDLRTGTLDLVVPGRLYDAASDTETGSGGGAAPSVSADGTRVAFVTRDALVAQDTNDVQDAYIRDMAVPLGQPGAFALVSALDGGADGLPWAPGAGGARLTGSGGAISADGRRVVFATASATAIRDGGPELPAGQLLVRDVAARTTTLVTRATGSGAAAGGADRATISADGSVVAWVGTNAAVQAVFAAGENVAPELPWILWRRVADPVTAPAARVAASGDPDVPGCGPADAGGPGCAGPFVLGEENVALRFPAPPALSSDGRRVAFTTSLRPRDVVQTSIDGAGDAFLAQMDPSRSTPATLRELTREGESASNLEQSSPVVAVALSADGGSAAFTTARTRLRLSSPVLIGDPPAPGLTLETYVVDLAADTVELVTRAPGGGKSAGNEAGTGDDVPKLSADGRRLAFTSAATNLIAGDVNGVPDAFTVTRTAPGGDLLPPQDVPPLESAPEPSPAYVLRAVGRPLRDGTLRVDAWIPGGGVLGATATRRAGGRQARVARLSRSAAGAGKVRVVLRPAARWRRAARRGSGLSLRLVVTFTPRAAPFAGRAPLRRTLHLRLRGGGTAAAATVAGAGVDGG